MKRLFTYSCHTWPSRKWCHEHHSDRDRLGIRLRDRIEKVGLGNENTHVVVLLGDFNDEPFSPSYRNNLWRQETEAWQQGFSLLITLFGDHLGASKPYEMGDVGHHRSGSYFYKEANNANG